MSHFLLSFVRWEQEDADHVDSQEANKARSLGISRQWVESPGAGEVVPHVTISAVFVLKCPIITDGTGQWHQPRLVISYLDFDGRELACPEHRELVFSSRRLPQAA